MVALTARAAADYIPWGELSAERYAQALHKWKICDLEGIGRRFAGRSSRLVEWHL
jgi:hypothetical protein